MTKSNVERTLDTLVDFADLNRQATVNLTASIEVMGERMEQANQRLSDRIDQMGERLERGIDRVGLKIDDLAVQIGNQAQSIDRLERSIDRLTENIDRVNSNLDQRLTQLNQAIDGHLRVAESQSANITELTKLVATQAATVNKLLDRAVA